jgi:hypothetical protein
MMRNTIYATFNDPKLAEKAAGALMDHGLRAEDLSIIQSHKWRSLAAEEIAPSQPPAALFVVPNSSGMSTGMAPFGITPMVMTAEQEHDQIDDIDLEPNMDELAKHGLSTTTPQDACLGAWKGTAWGAGVGALAALAALFVPGVGLVVGGGALATAIVAMAASAGAGAAAGAMTGYLKDQGVESHIAAEYERMINTGGAVLGATLPSGGVDECQAWEVLNKYAGQHVTSYVNRPYVS